MPNQLPYRVLKDRFANGLRLSTVEAPYLHGATVALYVRAGSRYETVATNGLSHFVEHMLFRGSARFPTSFALNLAIEDRGGTLYAETGRDYSLFQISLPPPEVPAALDILGDLFSNPQFGDIDLERSIILEEILEDLDDRGRNVNVHDLSRAEVWGRHPLGLSIIGPSRNVRRFRPQDVRRHFRHFYGARNMALCVAGRVDRASVRTAARKAFTGLPAGRRVRPMPARARLDGPHFRAVWNDSAQIQVQILFHGVPDWDPGNPALSLLLRLIDDGMSTPLHYRICDQQGLAYSVGASVEPLYDAALVEVDAACAPAKLPDLVSEVLRIVDGFRREPVTSAQLARARRRATGDLEAGFDDLGGLASFHGGGDLFFRPYTHQELLQRLSRVTVDDIRRIARRVFRPERLTVVAVGAVDRAVAGRVRRTLNGFGAS